MSSLDNTAAYKSIAGSSTLIPPVMFRKTSLASFKPALFENS
jgi:hypothetical protein